MKIRENHTPTSNTVTTRLRNALPYRKWTCFSINAEHANTSHQHHQHHRTLTHKIHAYAWLLSFFCFLGAFHVLVCVCVCEWSKSTRTVQFSTLELSCKYTSLQLERTPADAHSPIAWRTNENIYSTELRMGAPDSHFDALFCNCE